MYDTQSIPSRSSMIFLRKPARFLISLPPAYYVLLAVIVGLLFLKPQFTNPKILMVFLKQATPLGVVVLGQLLVMRLRSIDLSFAGTMVTANYLMTSTVLAGWAPSNVFLACMAVGALIGLFNGIVVGVVRASAVSHWTYRSQARSEWL